MISNNLGISCIGIVYGYILFYTLKRYFTPEKGMPVKELILLLGALSGSVIGISITSGYIGAYGLGLFVGAGLNGGLTWLTETRSTKGQSQGKSAWNTVKWVGQGLTRQWQRHHLGIVRSVKILVVILAICIAFMQGTYFGYTLQMNSTSISFQSGILSAPPPKTTTP